MLFSQFSEVINKRNIVSLDTLYFGSSGFCESFCDAFCESLWDRPG